MKAKQTTNSNNSRNETIFKNNVDFCRERLYNYYSDRAKAMFDGVISNEL